MDSSTNGQVKGGPISKSVNSRPSATRNMKTASPSQSPNTTTDNPRPATSRNAGPPSKSASAKVTSGAKEASNAKNSLARTAAASPNKPRSGTQKDLASPVKPPASQITRQQTRDKGTQQSPLPTVSKAETGKKSVEGAQPGKPKAEGGNSTPTKQNGATKKEVGRLTQPGIVPKDKTPCLQPDASGSGPTKPIASSSSPTKPAKMPLTLNKPVKSVPAPDKTVNTSPLPAKASKIKSSSPKLTNTSSPTTKAVKTASPLVKTPRLTSVPTKASTPPTSAVKPMNATSSPAKSGKTPLVKPVNTTSTSNQAKLAKQTTLMTKQPSGLNKPTNRLSVTSKPVTVTGKPESEKRPVPKPVKTRDSQQAINPQKLDNSEMNVNDVKVVHTQPEQIDTCPTLVNEKKAQENIVELAKGLLGDAHSTLKPCTVSTELSAESCAVNSEIQQSGSLDQPLRDLNNHLTKEVHSKCNAVSPSDEDRVPPAEQKPSTQEGNTTIELSHEPLRLSLESKEEMLVPVNLLEEGITSPLSSLQEETSPLELTKPLMATMSPEEEEVKLSVQSLQDELSSALDSSEMLTDHRKLLEEKVTSPVEALQEECIPPLEEVKETPVISLEESVKCLVDLDSNFSDKVLIPEELLVKELPSPVRLTEPLPVERTSSSETAINLKEELHKPVELPHHSKEEVELLEKATLNVHEDTAFEEEPGYPQKPLEEEIYSPVEHAEPSEEVQTSSLEQVTPLEEGVELSEDEVGFADEPNTILKQKGSSSLRHSEESVTLPADFCKPLEIQVTSSMEEVTPSEEEVTPSDEEMELSKAGDETLEGKIISSKQPDGEDSKCCPDLDKATEDVISTSVEATENLEEETKMAEEPEPLSVTLPGEYVKPLDELPQSPSGPADNVEKTFQEASNSSVILVEPVTYLEGIGGSKHETRQLTKGQVILESPVEDEEPELSSTEEQEETALFKVSVANYPFDQSNSITEPVEYESETPSDFVIESEEHLEEGNDTTNQDSEQFPEELLTETMKDEAETNNNSADLKMFEEQANMTHASANEPTGPLITERKQLDSAEPETDYVCFPINPEQLGLNSVLFPEEPLEALKQSEMALLETANYLVEAPKTSLEPLKHAEEVMTSSICELMGSSGDLVTAPVTAACQAAHITTSQFTECPESAETGPVHSISTTNPLPGCPGNILLESAELITIMETAKKSDPPEEDPDISMQEPEDNASMQPLGNAKNIQVFAEQKDIPTMPMEEEKEPNDLIDVAVEQQNKPIHLITRPVIEQNECIDLITVPVDEEKEHNLITVPVVDQREPIDVITMPVVDQNEPINVITTAVETQMEKCYLLHQTEDPLSTSADLDTDKHEMVEVEPFPHTAESKELPLISLAETMSQGFLLPTETAWSLSANNTEFDKSPTAMTKVSGKPISLPADGHVQHKTVTVDYLPDQTVNPAEVTVTAETISFSDEGIKGTIQALSEENQYKVDNKADLLICPTKTVGSWAFCQTSEKEQWVLVEKEELADFNEETEDKPQRPASLNQEGDNQEEPKAEEEAGERASVCSTLSDPQLAGKSSSETSTPEELRTYEDSSSGVESHSDDVATSPQTTLTPDPDLGIHMGQEEGSDTPAGTPASKSKGVPHPLQNASLEELSEGTSLSGVITTSEDKEIAHKMEVTGFTCPQVSSVSGEERAEERGPLRGNDD